MSGFFGGGGGSRVSTSAAPTASPAQEAYINASSPYYLNNLANANSMGNAGTGLLLSSILGGNWQSMLGAPQAPQGQNPQPSAPAQPSQPSTGPTPVPDQSASPGAGEGGSSTVGTAAPGAPGVGYPPVPPPVSSTGQNLSVNDAGTKVGQAQPSGFNGGNGLVNTLPGLLQLSPEELGLPSATYNAAAATAGPLAQSYSGLSTPNSTLPGVLSQLTGGMDSSQINNSINRLQAGPNSSVLSSLIAQLGGSGSGVTMPGMTTSDIDAKSLLAPLTEQFNEEIMPGIQSQALAAGAIGGGGQQDLTKRAAGNYGTMAMSEYARQKANLMNAATGRFSAEANAALGKGQLNQQGLTSAGNLESGLQQMTQQGIGKAGDLATTLRGLTGQELGKAGDLSISGQDSATRAAATQGTLAPILQSLFMAGPQQAAATAGQNRGMQLQQAQVPMTLANMLIGASSGIPSGTPPFSPLAYPNSTTTSAPSAGAQAGSAISSILPLIMMMMA